MSDSLRRLVERGDRERARPSRIEPERLILPPRVSQSKKVCFDCRRPASAEAYRAKWLADNPMPKRCPQRCAVRGNVASGHLTPKQHRQWHEDLYVSANMPDLKHTWKCPFCRGQLIEVTI